MIDARFGFIIAGRAEYHHDLALVNFILHISIYVVFHIGSPEKRLVDFWETFKPLFNFGNPKNLLILCGIAEKFRLFL